MSEIKIFTLAGDPLFIGDKITLELYRGHRGYYLDTPDEAGEAFDLVVNTGRTFLTRRLLALAARWGVSPERLGEGYEFTLPLAAIRFATPRRLSERQRDALQRGRGRSQEGHLASKGTG